MEIESKVRNFVLENYLFTEDESELENEDSFLDKGIIDSTGILELIFFIEETFSMKVEDEEMVPDNLDSVNSVVSYVKSKL